MSKRYLFAVKDCYSNRIVGYSIDLRMKASLAVAALAMALQRRHPALAWWSIATGAVNVPGPTRGYCVPTAWSGRWAGCPQRRTTP